MIGKVPKKVMKRYCEHLNNYDGTHDLSIMVDLLSLWHEGTRGTPGLGFIAGFSKKAHQVRWFSLLVFFLLLCSIQMLIYSAIAVMNFEFIEGSKDLRKMAQGFYWTAIAIQ